MQNNYLSRNSNSIFTAFLAILVLVVQPVHTKADETSAFIGLEERVAAVEEKVITWRRDFHQHPELSNREFRTAKKVAEHLRKLKLDSVRTEIAYTGVVGILKGKHPGPMVALRADMDALPVKEKVDLPFASKATGKYGVKTVPVMHACGHDAHTAILMGVAEVLAGMRDELRGSVMFIFQPAEEGAPPGEEGGAELMLKEGLFDGQKPDSVFALHVGALPMNEIFFRKGSITAASDVFHIKVKGKQTHGSAPWHGIDPITVASQIVTAIQLIPSRQLDTVKAGAVISVGKISGGIRQNIIPETVSMTGTIRTLDAKMRLKLHDRLKQTVENIAESAGAEATLVIEPGYPMTVNDKSLVDDALSVLADIPGVKLNETHPITGSEDFSFFAQETPGLYFFLGANMPGLGAGQSPMNHSPYFLVNEDVLKTGVHALTALTLDQLKPN